MTGTGSFTPTVYVGSQSTLIFDGNQVKIASDYTPSSYSHFVQVESGGTLAFNNAETYIGGFRSVGIRMTSAVMQANGLTVDIDRSKIEYDNVDDSESMFGVNVGDGRRRQCTEPQASE